MHTLSKKLKSVIAVSTTTFLCSAGFQSAFANDCDFTHEHSLTDSSWRNMFSFRTAHDRLAASYYGLGFDLENKGTYSNNKVYVLRPNPGTFMKAYNYHEASINISSTGKGELAGFHFGGSGSSGTVRYVYGIVYHAFDKNPFIQLKHNYTNNGSGLKPISRPYYIKERNGVLKVKLEHGNITAFWNGKKIIDKTGLINRYSVPSIYLKESYRDTNIKVSDYNLCSWN